MPRSRWAEIGLAALAGALAVTSASAAEPAADDGEPGRMTTAVWRHLLASPRLADDPGGARSRLAELGLGLQLFYNQYVAWKPQGGADTSSTNGDSGSYDFIAAASGEELLGWQGLVMLLHVKGQYDRNINADVGALSAPIDDADFNEPIYVDELWAEQWLLRDRARLRLGFLEQQTVFDRNAYANSEDRQFMTTFLDNNGVVPLPNGLGAVLIASPAPWVDVAAAVADADNVPRHAGFDTFFDNFKSLSGYLEATLRAELPGPGLTLPGTYRIGGFIDGRKKQVFGRTDPITGEPRTRRGNPGAYLSFDQLAFRESERDEQGLGLFARFGYADEDVNQVAWFWSVGLAYLGLLPGRDEDVLGVGTYQAIASHRYRKEVDSDFRRETGVELYYRIALLPWLKVTPDFQYIVDPGGQSTARNAVVVALRFRVTF